MAGVESLIVSLRSVDAPEELFPLAVTASALMAAADHPGPLLIAHLAILTIARDADGEPLAESDWIAIRGLLACLADLLESPETGTLDPLGSDWREWKRPAALH